MRYWEVEFKCNMTWSMSGSISFLIKTDKEKNLTNSDAEKLLKLEQGKDGLKNIIGIYELTKDEYYSELQIKAPDNE